MIIPQDQAGPTGNHGCWGTPLGHMADVIIPRDQICPTGNHGCWGTPLGHMADDMIIEKDKT